jgi:hypothetical protein
LPCPPFGKCGGANEEGNKKKKKGSDASVSWFLGFVVVNMYGFFYQY